MAKKQVTFNLEEDIIKEVKRMALDNDTTATEIYTISIREYLQRNNQQSTLD